MSKGLSKPYKDYVGHITGQCEIPTEYSVIEMKL